MREKPYQADAVPLTKKWAQNSCVPPGNAAGACPLTSLLVVTCEIPAGEGRKVRVATLVGRGSREVVCFIRGIGKHN
jgi:hypothetical protein